MQFKRDSPFDIPENPSELELMLGWFFDQLRVIVSIENHTLKYDSVEQLLSILHKCASDENINVRFSWEDGQWFIDYAEKKEDILNLPRLIKCFSNIYRHNASEYKTKKDGKSFKEIFGKVEKR